jgi:hypothetical protein
MVKVQTTLVASPRYHCCRQPGAPRYPWRPGCIRAPAPGRDVPGRAEIDPGIPKCPLNLLYAWANRRIFSECALLNKANQVDFDSAIPNLKSGGLASQIKALFEAAVQCSAHHSNFFPKASRRQAAITAHQFRTRNDRNETQQTRSNASNLQENQRQRFLSRRS